MGHVWQNAECTATWLLCYNYTYCSFLLLLQSLFWRLTGNFLKFGAIFYYQFSLTLFNLIVLYKVGVYFYMQWIFTLILCFMKHSTIFTHEIFPFIFLFPCDALLVSVCLVRLSVKVAGQIELVLAWRLLSTCAGICCKEIHVSTKIMVPPSCALS